MYFSLWHLFLLFKAMEKRDVVLKIGGSVLYQENQDINFGIMGKLKSWYVENREQFEKVVFITGGGAMSRHLQERMQGNIQNQLALHNIAMSVTQTSAELLAGYLGDGSILIPKTLGDAYEHLVKEGPGTIVSGGLKSGWSTDMDSVVFADILQEKRVYKISNIDYIYDEDPDKNPNAKSFKDMSWDDYFDLFSITENDLHEANGSIPIDRGCANFCKNKGISFFICGGENITKKQSIAELFSDGTLVHP